LASATRTILWAQLKNPLQRHLEIVCGATAQSEAANAQRLWQPFFAEAATPFLPLRWSLALLLLWGLWLGPTACAGSPTAKPAPEWCGEFGADLAWLADFYTPPQVRGESNHYIDLWSGHTLRSMAGSSGLTNNRTLFVNSHGMAVNKGFGKRYALYPHNSLLAPNQTAPLFSARDLAQLLGPAAAGDIHNIVLAACNSEGALSATEFRKYFVNATNITHCPTGQLGYQPMFLQAFLSPSAHIEPLYEVVLKNSDGAVAYEIKNTPSARATKLSPYVAELFRPDAAKPFRTTVAGRELLVPASPHSTRHGAVLAVAGTQP
jgi:hypothetical protein